MLNTDSWTTPRIQARIEELTRERDEARVLLAEYDKLADWLLSEHKRDGKQMIGSTRQLETLRGRWKGKE